jgi:hypothetical protein
MVLAVKLTDIDYLTLGRVAGLFVGLENCFNWVKRYRMVWY